MDNEDWVGIFLVVLVVGGLCSTVVLANTDYHADMDDHAQVIEYWDNHEGIRPFIAELMRDGMLSGEDYEKINRRVEEMYGDDYRDTLYKKIKKLSGPLEQEPEILDVEDPFLKD